MATRKQCLLDGPRGGQLHLCTHGGCASIHKTRVGSSQTKPSKEGGGGQEVPPLAEGLFITDSCQEKERVLFKGLAPDRLLVFQ